MTGANYTHFYAIVPKQPPPNAFFEACSLFKEKNFDLICESCLLFLWDFYVILLEGLRHLFTFWLCKTTPKMYFLCCDSCYFCFWKNGGSFQHDSTSSYMCMYYFPHSIIPNPRDLVPLERGLVTTTTIRTETIAWLLSQFSSRKISPTCLCNSNKTFSIFLYILSVGGVNYVLWKFAFSLNTSKKRHFWLVLSTANLVIDHPFSPFMCEVPWKS